jgi:hypothetical protein
MFPLYVVLVTLQDASRAKVKINTKEDQSSDPNP